MYRPLLFGFAFALAGVLALAAPGNALAQDDDNSISVPVTGTGAATDPGGAAGRQVSFDGTLAVRRFSARSNEVFVVGTLHGDFTDQSGMTLTTIVDEPVRVAVQRLEASCERLRVVLGPVNVDAPAVPQQPRREYLLLDLDHLVIELNAGDLGTHLARPVLCGVADITEGDVDLTGADLPVPADRIARILNQMVGLFR